MERRSDKIPHQHRLQEGHGANLGLIQEGLHNFKGLKKTCKLPDGPNCDENHPLKWVLL